MQQWVKEAAGLPRTRQRTPGARSSVAWTAQAHKSWKCEETQSDTKSEKKMRGRERRETETREKRESGGEVQEDRQRGGQRKDWGGTESETRLRKSERDGIHSFVPSFILYLLNTYFVPGTFKVPGFNVEEK